MMKLSAKILLLVLAFSTVAFAQTKPKPKAKVEKVFVEFLIFGGWHRSEIEVSAFQRNQNKNYNGSGIGGGFGGGVSHSSEGNIDSYSGSYGFVKSYKNSVIVNLKLDLQVNGAKPDDKPFFRIDRDIFVKRDEVVEIAFKNGIKVRAYFESAENIIKQGEIINNAENR